MAKQKFQFNVNGMIDSYGWQHSMIQYHLHNHKDEPVLCVVNSLGGDVSQAMAISKLFDEHGDVTVRFIACCASSATWMAFGAKEVEIAEDALLLVHHCSNLVDIYKSMKIDDIDKTIQQLQSMKKSQEVINLTIAKKYADRIPESKTLEDVINLMSEERWMTAEEAKSWGFVDKIIPGINHMENDARLLMTHNCASLNIPAPSFDDHNGEPEKNIVQQIVEGVRDFFKPKEDDSAQSAPATQEPENNVPTNNQTTFNMNKKFVNICTLLAIAVSAQNEETGDVTLTHDQLQSIENALAEAAASKQVTKDVEDTLDKVSDNIKQMDGVKNKALACVSLLTNLPMQAPAGNLVPKGESDGSKNSMADIAKDEVNKEAMNYYKPNK